MCFMIHWLSSFPKCKKKKKNSQVVEEVYVKNNKAKSDQSNLKVYSDSEEK